MAAPGGAAIPHIAQQFGEAFIDPTGAIVATYDKLHMFDVDLPTGETARELKAILGASNGEVNDDEEADWEDRLNQVMASRGRQRAARH